jgi:hypothetical protein
MAAAPDGHSRKPGGSRLHRLGCSRVSVNETGIVEPAAAAARRMAVFAGFTSFQIDHGGGKIGIDCY